MNRPLATALALIAALSLPGPGLVAAQGTEQGGFVTRLGSDTLAVERFTRTANRLEGERVLRVPRTALIRYVATLGKDGRVTVRGPPLRRRPAGWLHLVNDRIRSSCRDHLQARRPAGRDPDGDRAGRSPMLTHATLDEQMVQRPADEGDTVPMGRCFPVNRCACPPG
jgi:hypothetical protein